MTVWIKQGVLGTLQSVTRKGLGRVERLYALHNQDLYITSKSEGNHSGGSLHYEGLAFDIRRHEAVTLKSIKEVLGKDWDVVDETSHIHCEYDPKIV